MQSEQKNELDSRAKMSLNIGANVAQQLWEVLEKKYIESAPEEKALLPDDVLNIFGASIVWSSIQIKASYETQGMLPDEALNQITIRAENLINSLIMSFRINGFLVPQIPTKTDQKNIGIANNKDSQFGRA